MQVTSWQGVRSCNFYLVGNCGFTSGYRKLEEGKRDYPCVTLCHSSFCREGTVFVLIGNRGHLTSLFPVLEQNADSRNLRD